MDIAGKYWGTTRQVFFQNNVEIHYLVVVPGGYCSEHHHQMKFNRFVVTRGRLQVNVWKSGAEQRPDQVILQPFDECTIRPGVIHQFRNPYQEPCELLEIYWTQLDPQDIERRSVGGQNPPSDDIASILGHITHS